MILDYRIYRSYAPHGPVIDPAVYVAIFEGFSACRIDMEPWPIGVKRLMPAPEPLPG